MTGFIITGGNKVVQQSQRREWRKRRRRRNRFRFLLKIIILILILCAMGYGGKKIFDIYIAKASKGNDTSEITDATNSTDDPNNIIDFDAEKGSNETNFTGTPDITEKPDVSETPDGTRKPDETKKPGNTETPDATTTPDETKEPDGTDKSDETKKPDSSDQADKANNSDDTKAPDDKYEDNSEKMDESYFDDAVFIGDSRTEGFGMYSGLKNATFYSEKGLMVDTIFKDNVVKINGNKVTIMEALKKKSFGKVYIMLGVNELGWPYDDVFIDYYKKVIDAIKESQPQAVIYIQSIIRVSKEKDKNPPTYINNKRINRRNELIKKMAEKESVYYLDANEVLTDNSGYLFTNASTDGIHLNQQYCLIWKDYLLNHTSK